MGGLNSFIRSRDGGIRTHGLLHPKKSHTISSLILIEQPIEKYSY
jgi:hypothetical protein